MSKKGFIAGAVFGGVAMAMLTSQGADKGSDFPQDDARTAVSDAGTCRTLGINTDVPILQAKWNEAESRPYVQVTTFADRKPAYNIMLGVEALPKIGGEGCLRVDHAVSAEDFFKPHALLRDWYEDEYGKSRVADVEQAVQSLKIEHGPKPRL